jgi:hypothetical protein
MRLRPAIIAATIAAIEGLLLDVLRGPRLAKASSVLASMDYYDRIEYGG